MPYLNLDIDYFDHIKTQRLISFLGEAAALAPIRLWTHAGKVAPRNGVLRNYTPEEIERIAHWEGEKGLLVPSLLRLKFIKKVGNSYQINSWKDHEGHLIAFKERAVKAARKRWGMSDATSIRQASVKHTTSNAPTIPTLPNHTNHTLPTEASKGEVATLSGTATAQAAEGVNSSVYPDPDPKLEPERALACQYRLVRKMPVDTWKNWDRDNLIEFIPHAQTILENCGSFEVACQCLRETSKHFEAEGFLHWTIRGIAKKSYDWAARYKAREKRVVQKAKTERYNEDLTPMTSEEMQAITDKNLGHVMRRNGNP